MGASNRVSHQLIAVFTLSMYDEWGLARQIARENHQHLLFSSDNGLTQLSPGTGVEPSVISLNLGRYTLALVDEKIPGLMQPGIINKIDALVCKVIEIASCKENYLAVHDLTRYIADKQAIEKMVKALVNYHHLPEYKEFTDILLKLLEGIKCNGVDVETDFQKLKGAIINLDGQTKIKRISVLKHKIANCFLPVDIDLQGWREVDFNAEYGTEIKDAYLGKTPTPLEHARAQLYEGTYSLKRVLKKKTEREALAEACVMRLLPRAKFDTSDVLFRSASRILNDLETGNMDNVRRHLEIDNPFHDWFAALMNALDDLRDDAD